MLDECGHDADPPAERALARLMPIGVIDHSPVVLEPSNWSTQWVSGPEPPYDFVDIASVAGQPEAVYCFGDAELSFDARGTWCAPELPWGASNIEPRWLANACELSDPQAYMWMFLVPSSGLSAGATPMSTFGFNDPRYFRIVGHFDDPASQTCTVVPEQQHLEGDHLT